ncbi:MAG: hypothetical protein WC810_03010 [Janthinobacterium sp.]|jgi:hypothetical protein
MRSVKIDINTSQDLSLGALSYTATLTKACKLDQILIHSSVAITETITVTLDNAAGANYDTQLFSMDLSAESNFVWRPSGEMNLQAGDKLLIACTNANATGVVYATAKLSELGA